MAVTLFATDADGENYVANTTTFQFTVPGGVQQNDIIEFWVTTTSSTATTLTPSHSTASIMASYVSGDAALQAQGWYYRVPSTIPATISITLAAARQGSVVWRVWRGVDTTTALDATPTVFSNATPQASIALPSITTTTAGAYITGAIHNGSGGDGVTLASGWTLNADATRRNGLLVSKGTQATAGASGAAMFPWTSGAYTGRAVAIAWRAAATPADVQGAVTFVAHQDDDLGILNPDIEDDIRAAGTTGSVVTAYLTAGDDSLGWGTYAQGRESGIKAAYAHMASRTNAWTNGTSVLGGKTVAHSTLNGTAIRVYWLRLPDNATTALKRLWTGEASTISTVDTSTTYTKAELIGVLAAIIDAHTPPRVRHLNHRDSFGGGDHFDHTAAGRFGDAAIAAASSSPQQVAYVNEQQFGLPVNVDATRKARKTATLNVYAAFDPNMAGWESDPPSLASMERCHKVTNAAPISPLPPASATLFGPGLPTGMFPETDSPEPAAFATAFTVSAGSTDMVALGARIFFPSASASGVEGTGYFAILWRASASGVMGEWVASGVFGSIVRNAWNSCSFEQPITLTPGATYYVSVFYPNGMPATKANFFATASQVSPENSRLVAPPTTTTLQGMLRADGLAEEGWPPNADAAAMWWGVDIIVGEEVEPAITPTLAHNLTRPAKSTSFYVSSKTADATSVRVKAATNSALTTGVVFGSAGTPDADGYSRSDVTGLTPNTHYYYAIEMTDSAAGITTTAKVGEAWTLPTPGAPCASWVIGFGSCHDLGNQGGTSTAYTNLFAHNPQQVWSLGDTPYADSLSTSQSVHRGFMETQLSGVSGWKTMNANYALQYTKSDHDSSDNDSKTGAWTAPNRAATLQMFPQDDRPDPNGLYRYEVVGRVGIIYLDTRYFCTPSTKLGTTQMAWLKARLLEPEPVKLLVQDGVWIDNRTPDAVDDIWPAYPAERLEIANAPRVGRLYGVSGDQHAISADNGSHNAWGGWPTVCAAPFRNNASHKTANGPADWSNGIWPTTEGAVVNQHGTLTLLDDGTTITIQFRGYDGANVARVSMDTQFMVDDEADTLALTDATSAAFVRPRSAADGASLTDAASAATSRARTAADSAALSDSLVASLATTRAQGDALSLTDVAVAAATLPRSSTDAAVLSDAVTRALSAVRGLSDGLGLADAVTATLGASVAITDGLALGDVAARTASAGRSGADAAGLTDTVTRTLSAGRTQADGLGLGDQVTIELATAGEVLTQDGLTIGDQVVRVATSQRGPADGAGLSDSVTATLTRVVTITDLLNLADGTSVTSGGSTALADGLGLTDAVLVTRSSARPLSDPLTLSDTITLQRTVGILIADVLGVLDVVTPSWDGYQPVPLPDVLTVTLVPQEMATVTILDLNGRPVVGCVAELVEKRGDTRERGLILNRSLVGLAPSDLRILIASRTGVVETITPVIEDAEGGRISFRFTGTLPVGFYVLEVEVTTPTEVSTHPTDGFIQVTIEPDLGP